MTILILWQYWSIRCTYLAYFEKNTQTLTTSNVTKYYIEKFSSIVLSLVPFSVVYTFTRRSLEFWILGLTTIVNCFEGLRKKAEIFSLFHCQLPDLLWVCLVFYIIFTCRGVLDSLEAFQLRVWEWMKHFFPIFKLREDKVCGIEQIVTVLMFQPWNSALSSTIFCLSRVCVPTFNQECTPFVNIKYLALLVLEFRFSIKQSTSLVNIKHLVLLVFVYRLTTKESIDCCWRTLMEHFNWRGSRISNVCSRYSFRLECSSSLLLHNSEYVRERQSTAVRPKHPPFSSRLCFLTIALPYPCQLVNQSFQEILKPSVDLHKWKKPGLVWFVENLNLCLFQGFNIRSEKRGNLKVFMENRIHS